MPPQSHRDHGVAEGVHWLLDEELVPRGRVREPDTYRPSLLRHEYVLEGLATPPTTQAAPPGEPVQRNFLFFLAALVAALPIYLLVRGAEAGGSEGLPTRPDRDGSVAVTASFADEPRAGQFAVLRALHTSAAPAKAPTRAGRAPAPGKPGAPTKPMQPAPPPPPDDLLPPLPPPGPPLPDILPELPLVPELSLPRLDNATTLLDDH
jgi:hypothetical protein